MAVSVQDYYSLHSRNEDADFHFQPNLTTYQSVDGIKVLNFMHSRSKSADIYWQRKCVTKKTIRLCRGRIPGAIDKFGILRCGMCRIRLGISIFLV